jgi:hypothetical protein
LLTYHIIGEQICPLPLASKLFFDERIKHAGGLYL